ncbi:riboflavin synthase [Patescibacteria group bacterium]|nr:riboflavin synthase [Patescibacteria group bacterium]MBU1702798.1 riboflavin synthase [Patescibacteria group bacterium]MBU1953809.1 riboflavin synthase [Patescibacteria group bacterium]
MFTGIIREIATISEITQKENGIIELKIESSLARNKKKGDSIAVDGACLTITSPGQNIFTVEAIPETINKTNIKSYKPGTGVNLETPLKIGDGLDGHFVSGHIDFCAEVSSTENNLLIITVPPEMRKYFALKGSVAINGVSLTISHLDKETFGVSLIPTTLEKTNLGLLKKEDPVNIEIDLIARYLDSLLSGKEKEVSYDFLKDRGFL